jgi:hypothetical protein
LFIGFTPGEIGIIIFPVLTNLRKGSQFKEGPGSVKGLKGEESMEAEESLGKNQWKQ